MEWLNYHHLYYFWLIAKEGSLSRAASRLNLTHSTLSEQLKLLEAYLGSELFDRKGRRLVLTEFGAEVLQYATGIFELGSELLEFTHGRAPLWRAPFHVGVLGSIPKTVVCRLLEPAMEQSGASPLLEVRQGELDVLIGWLSRNVVNVVISDQLPSAAMTYPIHTHELGDTGIDLYGSPKLAARYRRNFPASIDGAPMLLPIRNIYLRQSIDRWLAKESLNVRVVGEFDDATTLLIFGAFGHGLFPVRSAVAGDIETLYGAKRIGAITGIRETYFALTRERKTMHPYVSTIIDAAKQRLRASAKCRKR